MGMTITTALELAQLTQDAAAKYGATRIEEALVALAGEVSASHDAVRHEADLAQQAMDELQAMTAERNALQAEVERLTEDLRAVAHVGMGSAATVSQPQPPAQPPLTDEQIDGVTVAQWDQQIGVMLAAYRAYARAVERAHGIGQEGGAA